MKRVNMFSALWNRKDEMKVCVLISTYNGERFLEEQIASIIAQKGVEVDILVRDDGSSDMTCSLLERWQKEGKLKWYKGENLGFARSFMNLLKTASGYDYYAFCDQDDIWLEDKLQRAVTALEKIEDKVRETFVFPEFRDSQNRDMATFLDGHNSVAIHARRGDMLGCNGYCYKFGYFKRAVKHIRENVENPVFVFFCDPGSVEWCKQNANIFGLDFTKDKVYFVDWNKGEESFRDMQLMGHCKHSIITNSSFGWWGAFFINNPNKITISPLQEIATNTTYHC